MTPTDSMFVSGSDEREGTGLPAIWHQVEIAAGQHPETVLLEDQQDRRMTAADFRRAVLRVAAGFYELGVGPGTRVMWQLPTSIEAVVTCLAFHRLGAVQNPLIAAAQCDGKAQPRRTRATRRGLGPELTIGDATCR